MLNQLCLQHFNIFLIYELILTKGYPTIQKSCHVLCLNELNPIQNAAKSNFFLFVRVISSYIAIDKGEKHLHNAF